MGFLVGVLVLLLIIAAASRNEDAAWLAGRIVFYILLGIGIILGLVFLPEWAVKSAWYGYLGFSAVCLLLSLILVAWWVVSVLTGGDH